MRPREKSKKKEKKRIQREDAKTRREAKS